MVYIKNTKTIGLVDLVVVTVAAPPNCREVECVLTVAGLDSTGACPCPSPSPCRPCDRLF